VCIVVFICIILWSSVILLLFRHICKITKSVISFVMRVCSHGATWLPWDGFSQNSVFIYVDKIQVSLKSQKITGTLHEDRYTFFIISRSLICRMRNISDKNLCRKLKHAFYVQYFFMNVVPLLR
jgi:hypothetical protein